MSSIVKKLINNNIINKGSYPDFLKENIHYEVIMGSYAYGVNSEDFSDFDIYGFCIPPKDDIFPHLRGEILGFGTQQNRFKQWQQHHIKDDKREYDFNIYSIIKYFDLCRGCNPNMIDSLFVPQRCILYTSSVGQLIRENRKVFLHKKAWHTFKGYAYQQSKKMQAKHTESVELWNFEESYELPHNMTLEELKSSELYNTTQGITPLIVKWATLLEQYEKTDLTKRLIDTRKHGYSTKFAYHIVRLLNEVEQILEEGDLDLERSREQLKSIRRGEWSKEQILQYFSDKEKQLENTYQKSTIPYEPDENAIKELLLNCLEMHFGSLDKAIVKQNQFELLLKDLKGVLNRYE